MSFIISSHIQHTYTINQSIQHKIIDPETIKLVQALSKQQLEEDMNKISNTEQITKKTIHHHLKSKWDTELHTFLQEVKRWKHHISNKQQRQRQILQDQYQQSMRMKQKDVRDAIEKVVQWKNSNEETVNRNYQHAVSTNGWSHELEQQKRVCLALRQIGLRVGPAAKVWKELTKSISQY